MVLPLARRCTYEFLCRYVYPIEKAYVDSHFVLDMFWTCDLSIYLYIFLTHMDAILLYESFYDDVECKCLCDVFLHLCVYF